MAFVITQGCCNDASCVAVCPVQCIRPHPDDPDFGRTEQLYIDPATCIDCGACMDECPVDAVHPDWEIPLELAGYVSVNADYFTDGPLADVTPPSFTRRVLPGEGTPLRVAVVGSGPAGCYAADALSEVAGVTVSLFERLPTPFGLVRAGVAPDHPDTKKIAERFGNVLNRENVRCFFNVEVGTDISLDELLGYHHAVLWAGGAGEDRRLGIAGEDLPGCHSARDFVAWYNGHPDHADRAFDLAGERVVVIGNGNVALDAARILSRSPEVLRSTDMADHAIEAFAGSSVREVAIVARRGPEHAAYSLGELMALDHIDSVTLNASPAEVGEGTTGDRRHELLVKVANRHTRPADRRITFRFGLEPVSIDGDSRVQAVTFRRRDGGTETIETPLVLRAIGYLGTPVPGLPFEDTAATIPNDRSRVVDPDTGLEIRGMYCAGWIKRGPRGTIGTNRLDAQEAAEAILGDFAAERLAEPPHGPGELSELLRLRRADLVDKAGWRRIDSEERLRGTVESRPRRKFVTLPELVAAARVVRS
jgi:ferredoxin--NADP+ reductase